MPIYDLSYRSYEGRLRRRGRWAVVVGQELRVLLRRRMFIFLVLLGNFHLFLRALHVYLLDYAAQTPSGDLLGGLPAGDLENLGVWVYFDFLRFQSPLVFLTLMYAGSGLICNDFRNNLTEIYFSKPINWRDYAIGKVLSLATIGLSLTALPALAMATEHVLLMGTRQALSDSLTAAVPILTYSLVLVLSFSLVILASSSIVNSAKFAGASVFLLTLINIALGGMLAGIMEDENYLIVAFPVSLNNLGEALFGETRYRNPVEVAWQWSAVYAAAVCTMALGVVCMKSRRAELGR